VKAELAHANTPDIVHTRISRPPLWSEMMNLKNPVDLTLSYLDGGEQAAISLASELQASLLPMDQRDGVAVARRRGTKGRDARWKGGGSWGLRSPLALVEFDHVEDVRSCPL
jgi:hypothetical protein